MSTSVLFDAPGPRSRRLYAVVGVIGVLVFGALLWFVIDNLDEKGQLTAEKWEPFLTSEIWTEYLIPGLIGTLTATVISVVLALSLGMVLGTGRLSQSRWIRTPCGVVVEFLRAVPVLLMMLFAYKFYAEYNVVPSDRLALAGVVTGLTLYNGSVVAELVRSGVLSLPKGQTEAAQAIGLRPSQTMRIVLLPQAITAMLPAIVSQLVVILKDSALGYIITYEELLRKAEQIGNYKSNLIPAFIVVAAIFIIMNWLLTVVAHRVERRIRRRGHSAGGALGADQAAAAGAMGAAGAVEAGIGESAK
jgi:glutamate transport system permease protein